MSDVEPLHTSPQLLTVLSCRRATCSRSLVLSGLVTSASTVGHCLMMASCCLVSRFAMPLSCESNEIQA